MSRQFLAFLLGDSQTGSVTGQSGGILLFTQSNNNNLAKTRAAGKAGLHARQRWGNP
ncbi:hypothetical protein [Paraburkholderia ginsengiterrae]|uniref:hypothetical protein n=1 Tax=Paraburkholderia ginsengiterrae TaxID=1462993 RepID=UPI000A66B76D|nr:hypothetical protein [Paraburkholderia ginsengiterrae]